MSDKNTGKFLGAIAFQGVDYGPLDSALKTLVNLLDTRLNDPTVTVNGVTTKKNFLGTPILPPGKVLLQPRGSYASRSAMRGHVDLDLDLVFPENFRIAFVGAKVGDFIARPINQVLANVESDVESRDPAGNLIVDKDGLRLVLIYVWAKLVAQDPDYALPNTFIKKPLDIPANFTIPLNATLLPAMRILPAKTLATLTRSISAQITDMPQYPTPGFLDLDFFVKVVTKRFGGEEVLVGVDKDGPLGVRQYQVTTFIPSGKEWMGTAPLSPINMTALVALKWWKNSFADDKTIGKFTVCLDRYIQ